MLSVSTATLNNYFIGHLRNRAYFLNLVTIRAEVSLTRTEGGKGRRRRISQRGMIHPPARMACPAKHQQGQNRNEKKNFRTNGRLTPNSCQQQRRESGASCHQSSDQAYRCPAVVDLHLLPGIGRKSGERG